MGRPLTGMSFRLLSEYELWCSNSKRIIFGKHLVFSSWCIRNTLNGHGKPFLNSFKSICRDLKAFGKQSKVNMRKVFGLYGKHLVIYWRKPIQRDTRAVFKIPTTFVFGKQTEWHLGKCDHAKSTKFKNQQWY